MKFKLKHWQVIAVYLLIYDIVTVVLSYFLALWFRFDCKISSIPDDYAQAYEYSILFYTLFVVLCYYFFGLYKGMWRFASFFELRNIILANAITIVAYGAIMSLFVYRMPISYYIFGLGFQGLFCLGIRFSYRFIKILISNTSIKQ